MNSPDTPELLQGLLRHVGAAPQAQALARELGGAAPVPFEAYVRGWGPFRREFCVKCGQSDRNLHLIHYRDDLDLLAKSCGRCGFGWYEPCKDSKQP